MFVGHYAAALAGRAAPVAVPLWVLFVAVQFMDFLWAGFILAGIEEGQIVEGFTAASDLDLYHMPYTHSLVGSLVWSVVFAGGYLLIARPEKKALAALITGGAVFSHWLTDLIVHVPDLPLLMGEPKFGFGLWRSLFWSQALEAAILLGGLVLYLRGTAAKNVLGRISPLILVMFLGVLQVLGQMPADPAMTMESFAVQALIVYSLVALAAGFVDLTRRPA